MKAYASAEAGEMSDVWIGALFTGLVALVGALTGAVIKLWLARHKIREEGEEGSAKRYGVIIDRLEQQLGRLEAHSEQQQGAIGELHDEHADCQVSLADMYGWLVRFRDMAVRWAEVARAAGEEPGEVPELPPRPHTASRLARAQFLARSTEQNTALAKQIDQKLREDDQAARGGA